MHIYIVESKSITINLQVAGATKRSNEQVLTE